MRSASSSGFRVLMRPGGIMEIGSGSREAMSFMGISMSESGAKGLVMTERVSLVSPPMRPMMREPSFLVIVSLPY